jgi:uncharacterized membrane protein
MTNQLDKLQICSTDTDTPKKKTCFYRLVLMNFYFPSYFLFCVEVGVIKCFLLKMLLYFSLGSGDVGGIVSNFIFVSISTMPLAQ